jgi:hypothetical protein
MALGTMNLPTNGALMTGAQLDALGEYVRSGAATPAEQGMYRQIQTMLIGFEAIDRAYKHEQHCRIEAERKEGDLVIALGNLQRFVQSLPKKAKLADYRTMVEQMRAEIETAMSEKEEAE